MRQGSILLLTLALLCLHTNAFSLFELPSLRKNLIMNAHTTSSGRIDLKKDSYSSSGFYVEADFSSSRYSQNSSSNSSNSTINSLSTSDTVKMMISIANEDTIVATNCLSFGYYDCSRYNCYKFSSSGNIDYPTFTATVSTQVKSYIHLDYNYWNIDTSYFYMASSCQTGDTSSGIGYDRYGVLGLGTGASSKVDFTSSAIFSIFINSNLSGGKLLFMKDTDYSSSYSALYTFYGNSTWQIPTYSAYIKTPSYSVNLKDGNIMFDVNSDAIGLPSDYYSLFITYFGYMPNIWCNTDNYRPQCYTSQRLEDLPDIILAFNNYELKIPSKIYATYTSTSGSYTYFSFNFKATSPSLTGKNYVSPSFKNSIIFDAHFMSYYYTVFDATGNTNAISLYPSTNAPVEATFPKWIALGAVGILMLVGICCCCAKKKTAVVTNDATAAVVINTTDGFNATQAPLVFNTPAPNYPYGTTNYNYPGYSYPTQPQVYQAYPAQPQGGVYVPPTQTGNFQERAKQ